MASLCLAARCKVPAFMYTHWAPLVLMTQTMKTYAALR